MLFNNHRRPILKKEHTSKSQDINDKGLSLPEVSKIIGEEWGKLTDDQKKVSLMALTIKFSILGRRLLKLIDIN